MRRILKGLLPCVALSILASSAFGAVELQISSGATPVDVVVGAGGSVGVLGLSYAGWTITIIGGLSNTPNTDPALDLAVLATCSATCTTPLDVKLSDTGFNPANAGWTNTFSATITGNGTATETGYVDSTNTLFGEPAAGKIGTVTLNSTGSGTISGTVAPAVNPSSATLDDVFSAVQGTAYSTDGALTNVPEPVAVLSLGTLLLGLGGLFSKKFRASNR